MKKKIIICSVIVALLVLGTLIGLHFYFDRSGASTGVHMNTTNGRVVEIGEDNTIVLEIIVERGG